LSEIVPKLEPAFPAAPHSEPAILYGDPVNTQSPTESELRRYWRILLKHRFVVLGAIGCCLALSLAITIIMPREFTAVTRIQVARQAPKVVNLDQGDDDQSAADAAEFYQTQYELLKSRTLSEAVVRDLGLAQNSEFLFGHLAPERVSKLPAAKRMELAATKLNKNTIVAPVRGSSIIDLGFRSRSPQLAAVIANSLAQNFIQSNLARRYEAAAYARNFLQQKLDQTRAKLEESERKAVMYAEQAGLIKVASGDGGGGEQSLVAMQLAELSTQLTQARAARVQAEAQFRAGAQGSAAEQSLNSTTINTLRSERADLIGQLSKLESDFGPKYPPVVALHAQIAELDRQIASERSHVNTSVDQDLGGKYRQAVATERDLQSKVDQLKGELLGEQTRSIQYNTLERDVATNRALYEALLQRFKDVGIAGGVGTNNVSIVDPALPPEFASSPNIPLNLALGLIFGLLIGCAAAVVLEMLAESIVLPTEFQHKLHIPLLGTTPATKGLDGGAFLARPTLLRAADGKLPATKEAALAEAYFSIVTAVQFSTSAGTPRVLAVVSSQSGEGKTTTAMALARGLAATGARVLLIDGDMRNPTLHRAYNLPRDEGLSNVLTGNAELQRTWKETAIKGVTVLTAGRIPPNPAELLASDALPRTIKEALGTFDNIIFDAPPILGLADAPLLARAADGAVFVIQADRTRASDARQALERLTHLGAHVLGAVLTKLDPKKSGAGYGYSYTYDYGTR
jgi:capsular exopolysaccharide synthesis family protein